MLAHPDCVARLDARLLFGFTIGDASAYTRVHFCRHGLRRTTSLHFLLAVHNLLLSCNLQPGRGDALHRPLLWGLDVSGILQSRAEDRCNPPSSPPRPLCKSPNLLGFRSASRRFSPSAYRRRRCILRRFSPRTSAPSAPQCYLSFDLQPSTVNSLSPHNLALALLSNLRASLCETPARTPPSRPRSEFLAHSPRRRRPSSVGLSLILSLN